MTRIAALQALRRRFARQEGVALVLALGISVVAGLTGVTMMAYTSTNYGAASRSKADQTAYALAEAGINDAMAVLANPSSNALDPTLLPARTSSYDGGTVTWSGTLDRTAAAWTLTSIGAVRNPTGTTASAVQRKLTATVTLTESLMQQNPSPSWNYLVATKTGTSCDENVSSGVVIGAPFYVMGNMCLAAGVKDTAGPLAVKGKLSLANSDTMVGSSTAAVSEAHVGSGCVLMSNAQHTPCSSVDNVWARVSDATVPVLTPPSPAWDAWFHAAAPGPFQSCAVSSGTPPVFDNETNPVRNLSVTTAFSLTPATSYTCRVGPSTKPIGEISWDATNRVLTVNGTIFIDGSAKVDNGLLNTYRGQGSIYLSGTFLMTSNSKLCAAASGSDCDFAHWDPNSTMLAIVSNGNGQNGVFTGDSILIGSYGEFEGGLYGTYAIQYGNYAKAQGPVIGYTLVFGSSMQVYSFPYITTPPAGLPGGNATTPQPNPPTYTG